MGGSKEQRAERRGFEQRSERREQLAAVPGSNGA